jgi:hypothetical protein
MDREDNSEKETAHSLKLQAYKSEERYDNMVVIYKITALLLRARFRRKKKRRLVE